MIKYGIFSVLMKQLILFNWVILLMKRMTDVWQYGHRILEESENFTDRNPEKAWPKSNLVLTVYK